MDCSDVNASDIFWNGAVIFNASFLSGFFSLEWYHHSTIKRGSQSFFCTKHPLSPLSYSVSSCEKNHDLSGNRNIIVRKPSARIGRPHPSNGRKRVAFCPLPTRSCAALSVCSSNSRTQVVNLTLQDIFQAGSFPTGQPGDLTSGKGEIFPSFEDFAHRTS